MYIAWLNDDGEIYSLELEPTSHTHTESGTLKILSNQDMQGLDGASFMERYYWSGAEWSHRGYKPNPGATWDSINSVWDKNLDYLNSEIKLERTRKLYASDWTLVADSPLTEEEQTEARNYRATLRDLPSALDMSTIDSIDDVSWPTPPSFIG